MAHCRICHKELSDPISVKIGIGPECRNKPKIYRAVRTVAFREHRPFVIGRDLFIYQNGYWTNPNYGLEMDEEKFKAYMLRYDLIMKETE